jgi:hypothetical protein
MPASPTDRLPHERAKTDDPSPGPASESEDGNAREKFGKNAGRNVQGQFGVEAEDASGADCE